MNKTIETLVRILDEERTDAATRAVELGIETRHIKTLEQTVADLETKLHWAEIDTKAAQSDLREERRRISEMLRAISKYVVPAIFERGLDYFGDPIDFEKQKIPFIKIVREESGLGLKEAKDLVDAFLFARKSGLA